MQQRIHKRQFDRGYSDSFPPTIEVMENRVLMSVTSWSSDSISDVENNEFATIQYGDDGDADGIATGIAGQGYNQDIWTSNLWDDNPDDGVDSGCALVSFSVNSANDGNMNLTVGGQSAGTYSVGTGTAIHSVTIQADAAYGGLKFSWTGITVSFFHNGTLVDSQQPSDLNAGSLTSTSMDPSEAGEIITTGANANGVTVTGIVRLQAASGVYPGGSDVFGQVSIG